MIPETLREGAIRSAPVRAVQHETASRGGFGGGEL
jgi:uncharacterized protein YgiB involved in biofilm formation